jgi:predicted DNA repair protein MutK
VAEKPCRYTTLHGVLAGVVLSANTTRFVTSGSVTPAARSCVANHAGNSVRLSGSAVATICIVAAYGLVSVHSTLGRGPAKKTTPSTNRLTVARVAS